MLNTDLQKHILALLEELKVPGLSIAIFHDAKLSWRRAFGFKNSVSKEPVDHTTVFEIGSPSKPVFAYAVMKLCENGVMDLDTPLTKYTSERFLDGDSRLDLITARHVLSHTSGFQNWRSTSDPLRIHFTPGERYFYSGEGYSYLQSVVTHLTGHVNRNDCERFEDDLEVCATDFEAYMKANVLEPFEMSSSAYTLDERLASRSARPHDDQGRPFERKSTAPSVARYGAAGGLYSTPTDYAKFLIKVIDPKPADRFRLTRDSIEEMLRPQVKVDDSKSRGLDWTITQTKEGTVISRDGSNPGFHCFSKASLKDKSGYVVMTNGDNGWKFFLEELLAGGIMDQLMAG
jgi:CubicO group peptidase (beta-lactamase class C family)